LPHRLIIDAEVPLSSLTTGLMQSIDQLEPYGAGNPAPLMLADRLQVVGAPKKVGKGERHLSMRLRQNGREMRAIAFGMVDRLDELMSQGGQCSIVFTPRWHEYMDYKSVDIQIKDFQAGPEAKLD
jgi:single-stranded-DNA-specific exonuclease